MSIKPLLFASAALIAFHENALAGKSGPYVGAQLGVSATKSNGELTIPKSRYLFPSKNTTRKGLTADLVAGYLFPLSSFLVGGEATLGMDLTNSKKYVVATTNSKIDDTLILKRKATSTFNAVVAKQLHKKVTVYAKAGVGFSRFKTQLFDDHKPKKSTTRPSFTCALGMETPITKKISVRAEASYERFKTVNATPIDMRGRRRNVDINVKHKKIQIAALKIGAVVHI